MGTTFKGVSEEALFAYLEKHKNSLNQEEYNAAQLRLAETELNEYYTWLEVHHRPNFEELIRHYIVYGGAKEFANNYNIKGE